MGKGSKRREHHKKYYKNEATLTVYLVLRMLVILSLIRAVLRQEYHSVFLCVLSLWLMLMPSIIAKHLEIQLPSTLLEIIILLFIFAAEILGEINSFYVRVPHWDTMLHTINGFLCAAIGFAMSGNPGRNQQLLCAGAPLGYHAAHHQRILVCGHRLCDGGYAEPE